MNNLNLSNVSQTKPDVDRINIHFTSNEQVFTLMLGKNDHFFEPLGIYHTFDEMCRICGKEQVVCSRLSKVIDQVFYQLIEHPSLRLEWLYLPYRLEVEHDA